MTYKLLVVDDHPETRNIITRVLKQQGYQVVAAESGVQALGIVDRERPHLILLDMMMPEMDGIETCRRIRAKQEMTKVPIIMFTAVDEPEQKLAGFNAGVDDYLIKPTEPVELIDRVGTMLESAYGEPPPTGEDVFLESEPPSITHSTSSTGQVIAVLGARGGSGTTTVAINLAVSLAENGQTTTLLDLDAVQGHIGLYLNQKVPTGLQTAMGLPNDSLKQFIAQQRVQYGDHLQLLLSSPNSVGRLPVLSADLVTRVVQQTAQTSRYVVVDCGNQISAVIRPVLDEADQVIICLRPERVSLLAAKQMLTYLKETLFPHTSLRVLMVEAANGVNLPQGAVESYLGQRLWSIVPMHGPEMTQAVNKGLPLVKAFQQLKATLLFQQFAQQLAQT